MRVQLSDDYTTNVTLWKVSNDMNDRGLQFMDLSSSGELHGLDRATNRIEVWQLREPGSGTHNEMWGDEHLGGFEFCRSYAAMGVASRADFVRTFGALP